MGLLFVGLGGFGPLGLPLGFLTAPIGGSPPVALLFTFSLELVTGVFVFDSLTLAVFDSTEPESFLTMFLSGTSFLSPGSLLLDG